MTTAYATEASDVQDSQPRKQNGFDMTHMTPGTLQRVRQSLFRRATQRRVLKLKVDTSSIFFNIQEAVILNSRFKRPTSIEHFFLYCGGDSRSVG
jgi:hypothetical protein